jgi:hypothetical protein
MEEHDRAEARAIVESLRYGTPPTGHVREFTVGRQSQLKALEQAISRDSGIEGSALLVRANYGAGKSHLLRIVRERALNAGFAVSLVVTDAAGGVRFNRMDTIFGAVTREIEVPGMSGTGVRTLFDLFRRRYLDVGMGDELVRELSVDGTWAQAGQLSDPILIGLRAWVVGSEGPRSLVEEWYAWPEPYRNRRKDLYWGLVADLEHRFDDRRTESRYYIDNAFGFHADGHTNSWDALGDLHAVAVAAGLNGLILLFDEFEDVIQNLNRSDLQVAAFENLFDFFSGDSYPGPAYFAVTPEFAQLCRNELVRRGRYDFPLVRFTQLPAFELAPINEADFRQLAERIAEVHGIALGWDAARVLAGPGWPSIVRSAWGNASPDRIRQAIQRLVGTLDASARA